jgi:hypothetical protein
MYVLIDTINYKEKVTDTPLDVANKFSNIIMEYMNIYLTNHKPNRFIFIRGVKTLVHVFSFLFYYTQNLELTYYHTQKAFYYYNEFIQQTSNVSFLNLTSRDAVLFVYKKTIYELNKDYVKDTSKVKKNQDIFILSAIESYLNMYQHMLEFVISHVPENNMIEAASSMIKLFDSAIFNKEEIECICIFTRLLNDYPISFGEYYRLIQEFLSKVKHIKDYTQVNHKMHMFMMSGKDMDDFDAFLFD